MNSHWALKKKWLLVIFFVDLFCRCRVIRFLGHLKTLSRLPKSLKRLRITFTTTEHAQQLLKELTLLVKTNDIKSFGMYNYISMHLTWQHFLITYLQEVTSTVIILWCLLKSSTVLITISPNTYSYPFIPCQGSMWCQLYSLTACHPCLLWIQKIWSVANCGSQR